MRFLLHIKILRLCKESETLDLYPILKETMEIWKSELLILQLNICFLGYS